MKLRQLEYFVAAAEELHFGRAAARMGISQPSLTEQIQRLERQLDTMLFDRDSHTVELTATGELLFGKARATLESADSAARAARHPRSAREPDIRGSVRIGFCCSATRSVLPAAIRAYSRHHPAAVITLKELWSTEQLAELVDRRLDVAFVLGPVDDPALRSCPVARDRFVAVLPADHRLARHDSIDVAELASTPVVLFRRDLSAGLYDRIMSQLAAAGVVLDIAHEVSHPNAVPILAATGVVGLVSTARAAQVHIPGVVTRQLTGAPLEEDIHMVWRADETWTSRADFVSLVAPLCDPAGTAAR
jgi:DNA-binding transcriptional LysR family regulator